MYSVKISNIKKIYPAFKPSNINIIKLAQPETNLGLCDHIIMNDGIMVVVSKDSIDLLTSEWGLLDIEAELKAHINCHNTALHNKYAIDIVNDEVQIKV